MGIFPLIVLIFGLNLGALEAADKADGLHDGRLTKAAYIAQLHPITTANHDNYNK